MKLPVNLVQHLCNRRKTSINICSDNRVYEGIEVCLGYLKGPCWINLVEACEFSVGFKIFFFPNGAAEFEMIIVGFGSLEAVYEWSRLYQKIVVVPRQYVCPNETTRSTNVQAS